MKNQALIYLIIFVSLLLSNCQISSMNRINSSLRFEDFQTAIMLLREYSLANPDSPSTRRKLGYALLQDGQFKESAIELETSLEKDSRNSFALLYLGLAYLRLQELEKAMLIWEQYSSPRYQLIGKELAIQREKMSSKGSGPPSEMVADIYRAIMEAVAAERLRDSYRLSRLGECG